MADATVLLVDDYDDIREIAEVVLSSAGYVVLSAPDAETATALAASHLGDIDVLLTDVSLPGMRGVELARRLTAARPSIRTVLMSGSPPLPGEESLPGSRFLQKPFDADSLLAAIAEAVQSP